MSSEYRLQLPTREGEICELNCGDTVYVSGVVHTMRDMGHRRAVEMLRRGEKLPFDLSNGAVLHCGPITRQNADGKWQIFSAGPTTSSRFNELGPELMRAFQVRCTIGKGSMGTRAVETIRDLGGFFLNATGGCGALYAGQVEEVIDVFWTDLGMPEAIWVLRVKDLGPLVVGIDSNGNRLIDDVSRTVRTNLASIYEQSGIAPDQDLAYLPKRVAAKASRRKDRE
jgi:fumarate hydratase subunit beta